MKQMLIFGVFFVLLISGLNSQEQNVRTCSQKIDQLYKLEKDHLIFCSYYFEKISSLSGADTILPELPFHRDLSNLKVIQVEDSSILANLKKRICAKNQKLILSIKNWCRMSKNISRIRTKVDFSDEGYMDLLNNYKYTRPLIRKYLGPNRFVASLSSYEMVRIYFESITVLMALRIEDQESFFTKMRKWKYI